MNRDRGAMGGCSHTNDQFYGQNGCHACDRDLEEWLERQEKDRQAAQAERERQAREKEDTLNNYQ